MMSHKKEKNSSAPNTGLSTPDGDFVKGHM